MCSDIAYVYHFCVHYNGVIHLKSVWPEYDLAESIMSALFSIPLMQMKDATKIAVSLGIIDQVLYECSLVNKLLTQM